MSQELYIFFKKEALLKCSRCYTRTYLIKSSMDKSTFWNVGTNQDILSYKIHYHTPNSLFGIQGALLMKKCCCGICSDQVRIYIFYSKIQLEKFKA